MGKTTALPPEKYVLHLVVVSTNNTGEWLYTHGTYPTLEATHKEASVRGRNRWVVSQTGKPIELIAVDSDGRSDIRPWRGQVRR